MYWIIASCRQNTLAWPRKQGTRTVDDQGSKEHVFRNKEARKWSSIHRRRMQWMALDRLSRTYEWIHGYRVGKTRCYGSNRLIDLFANNIETMVHWRIAGSFIPYSQTKQQSTTLGLKKGRAAVDEWKMIGAREKWFSLHISRLGPNFSFLPLCSSITALPKQNLGRHYTTESKRDPQWTCWPGRERGIRNRRSPEDLQTTFGTAWACKSSFREFLDMPH